jgi:hypothetical protein
MTPEQLKVWEEYHLWYQNEGWLGDRARQLAWADFTQEFPEFKGSNPPDGVAK